jgi:hypothetical protein
VSQSLLHLPDVPVTESRSFKQRILAKHRAYVAQRATGKANAEQAQGERYEIAVALHLYRNHLLNRGDYLSRWQLPDEKERQSVHVGYNNEYDFLLRGSHGLLLGDAKDTGRGLGEYLKKAISFCLFDFHVRNHVTGLSGFCFATPQNREGRIRAALRNAYEILTAVTDCAGITGMNSQLIPADIKKYFRSRYLDLVKGQIVRESALTREVAYYVKELENEAGFTIDFLQVQPMSDDVLEKHMVMLETKQRWSAAGTRPAP